METRVLTAHVPAVLAEKIDELALRLDRSRGWIVKQALAEWVDLEERRRLLTLEALDDVTNGSAISHEDMLAWAESLEAEPTARQPLGQR